MDLYAGARGWFPWALGPARRGFSRPCIRLTNSPTHQLTHSPLLSRRDAWPLLIEWLRRDEVDQRTDRREAGVVRVRTPVADRATAPLDETGNQLLDFLEIHAEIEREAVRRPERDRWSAQRRQWEHSFPHDANS